MAQYMDKNLVFEIVKGVFNLLIEEDKVKSLLPKINNDAPEIYEEFMPNLSDLYKFVNNEYKDKIINVVLDNIALDNFVEVKEVDLEKELENLLEKEKTFVTDNREVKYYNGDSFNHIYELEFIAKYFYELGLKTTQKGECICR